MRALKIIFKIIIAILIILFLALTIFLLTFDLNRFRPLIVTKASEALGRTVTIEDMSMKVSLIPTVAVKGVKVFNSSDFDAKTTMAQIDEMDVTLALLPLMSGNVELKDFNLGNAMISLVRKGDKNNWTFGNKTSETATAKPASQSPASDPADMFSRLRVDNISIKQLSVSYTDNDKTQNVSIANASVKQLQLFSLTLIYDGKAVKLSGNLGDVAGFLAKKTDYTFNLEAQALGMNAKIAGKIGDTENLRDIVANVEVKGSNLSKTVEMAAGKIEQVPAVPFALNTTLKGAIDGDIQLSALTVALDNTKAKLTADITAANIQKDVSVTAQGSFELNDAKLAFGFGIKPISGDFNVYANKELITLKTVAVNANKSDIVVKGSVSLKGTVPDIAAALTSQYLDIEDFIADKPQTTASNSQTSQKSGPMFSSEKIDLSALKTVNAKVDVSAKNIKIPDLDYIGLTMMVTLQNGNLNVSSLTARTVAGDITGNAKLNAAAMPAVAAVKLNADDLKLNTFKPITEHLKDSTVSANINLTTKGDSVKSFVDALNGQILIEVSEGKIVDKWFNSLPATIGMIRNKTNRVSFSSSDQVSELVCGAINLNVKNGVITSDNQIAIETSAVNFAVSGDINLPQERLSLTMVPSMPTAGEKWQDALALTQVVKISGPFTDLKPSVDTKKVTQEIAQAGLSKLADRIAEKEGITLPLGQSKTDSTAGYNLCEKALGRPLKGQTQNRAVPKAAASATVNTAAQTATAKETQKADPKDQFKRQLLNSLSEALKK